MFNPSPENKTFQDTEQLTSFGFTKYKDQIHSVETHEYFGVVKQSGTIYEVRRRLSLSEKKEAVDYVLREQIDSEDFIFRLVEAFGYGNGTYSLDFVSEKYMYALMGFSKEGLRKLEKIVVSFLHEVLTRDKTITKVRFSGAPASYTKEAVDEARNILSKEKRYIDRNISTMRPEYVEQALYYEDIEGTDLQKAENRHAHKRDAVFSYRLKKAFDTHNLPYTISENWGGADVVIERK